MLNSFEREELAHHTYLGLTNPTNEYAATMLWSKGLLEKEGQKYLLTSTGFQERQKNELELSGKTVLGCGVDV